MTNEHEAVRDFMGDRPGADELSEWRNTLEGRLKSLETERDKGGTPEPRLLSKIAQLKKQIAALQQEEAITQFVEDSVRATLAMGATAPRREFEGADGEE